MTNAAPRDISLACLVQDFYPYVRRLALTILDDGSPDVDAEADDAAQDIFMLAARALPGFRGKSSRKTWLTTISVNHCRGRLRKRRSRLRVLDRFVSRETGSAPIDGPEALAVVDHEKRALWIAVDALPEKQRIPILLFYVHELSTTQIAGVLGLPEGTVHSRLHHARRKLQTLLEENDG